jgi:hypothetical protein
MFQLKHSFAPTYSHKTENLTTNSVSFNIELLWNYGGLINKT